jgi:hypothetical protein
MFATPTNNLRVGWAMPTLRVICCIIAVLQSKTTYLLCIYQYDYAYKQNINAKMATSTILFELSYLYGNEGNNFCFQQHRTKTKIARGIKQ